MTRTTRRPYMYEGRVVRDPSIKFSVSSFWKFVDWKRVVSLFLPVFLLVVTNPANSILSTTKTFSPPSASASSSWFVVGRPRITNYGVFALHESLDGVTVLAVLSELSVCSFNDVRTRRGAFCESLADTLCHRKPLLLSEYWYNERSSSSSSSSMTAHHRNHGIGSFAAALAKDRVFLVHRLICWILILTASFNFCCPRFPPRRTISGYLFYHPIIDDVLTSVLFSSSSSSSNNNLVTDLLRHNFIIYPVLVELDRMVPQLAPRPSGWWYGWILRPTGQATADFLLTVVLLMLLAGAANVLASRITTNQQHHRVVGGFASCTAAGLGYLQRCAHHQNHRSWILLAFGTQTLLPVWGRNDTAINTVHVFWSSMAWMVVSSDNWYPRLVVWLLGGVVGTLLAEFHLQHSSTAVGYYQEFLRYIGF